jgi:methyl-accepting chemotaxis protein
MAARRRFSTTSGLESQADEATRARDVLLERIESQMQFVIEAVTGMREDFDTKLTALEARLSDRIRILEEVVRQNSKDIRDNTERIRALEEAVRKNTEDIRKNSEDIKKNSEDIKKNSEDIKKNSEDIRKNSEAIKKNSEDIAQLRREVAGLRRDFERREDPGQLKVLEERVLRVERKVGIVS